MHYYNNFIFLGDGSFEQMVGRYCIYVPELGTRSLFPVLLSAHFISMDRYRSSAHLANFQVRSSLNRSQKNQWFALGKER